MSRSRLPENRGFVDPSKLPRGPNGRACCRQCGQEVPKGSRTFCGSACVDAWKERTDPNWQRTKVLERDQGVCAICGLDTIDLYRWRSYAFRHCVSPYYWPPHGMHREWINGEYVARPVTDMDAHFQRPEPDARTKEQVVQFLRATEPYAGRGRQTLWDMDHVLPVVEGGGACGLENLRTLCLVCHKQATKELAARRAERRKTEPQEPKKAQPGRRHSTIYNPVRKLALKVCEHAKQGHDRQAVAEILRTTNRWMNEEDWERCQMLLCVAWPSTWGVTATLGLLAALDPIRERTREDRDRLIGRLRQHLQGTRPAEVDELMQGVR